MASSISLVQVSEYHSTGHPSLTTQFKFTSNNRSHNMTLPLQDQTTEAARRDSGTTKAVAVDGSASSKYIKWYVIFASQTFGKHRSNPSVGTQRGSRSNNQTRRRRSKQCLINSTDSR